MSDITIFNEAVVGYGFTEVDQTPDGVYCTGCMTTHKRPTKMYSNGQPAVGGKVETLCRYQIVRLYNPGD